MQRFYKYIIVFGFIVVSFIVLNPQGYIYIYINSLSQSLCYLLRKCKKVLRISTMYLRCLEITLVLKLEIETGVDVLLPPGLEPVGPDSQKVQGHRYDMRSHHSSRGHEKSHGDKHANDDENSLDLLPLSIGTGEVRGRGSCNRSGHGDVKDVKDVGYVVGVCRSAGGRANDGDCRRD